MNISIFGSCVTRDIFNYIKDENIKLINYYARSSIVSIVSESLNKSIYGIDLESKFQRKMVYNDVNKLIFKELDKYNSDILLIDLIDERFGVIKLGKNKYITKSAEYSRTNEFKKKFKGEIITESNRIDLWEKSFDKFISLITKKIGMNNIYINECYYCYKYIDNNNQIAEFSNKDYIEQQNKILAHYYKYIRDNYDKVRFLNSNKQYFADEKHRWGLSPFHYEEKYYYDLISNLNKIEVVK